MSWHSELRATEATNRRAQRAAAKRLRELERQTKEQAKLSAIEQAVLEVRTHDARLDLLLSIHKEQGPSWDWALVAASLPPSPPTHRRFHELKARQDACLIPTAAQSEKAIAEATARDRQEFEQALQDHAAEVANIEKLKPLALGILAGDPKAYKQAIVELGPFAELSTLGSTMNFTVHSPSLLECVLKVHSTDAIPSEVKSVTATGKLSVKPMPRARFHELFQDYICSCMLRVAREMFALLPIDTLIITALADLPLPESGKLTEVAVLSASITRTGLAALDFENLDPSDATEQFYHRGDFKASRRSGAFAPIIRLAPSDLVPSLARASSADPPLSAAGLLDLVRQTREDLRAALGNVSTPDSLAPK